MHTSHPFETHYFPLMHSPPRALLLHTHSSGPYTSDIHSTSSRGLNLTIYSLSSSSCITGVDIEIDWWSTVGRWGSRYLMTVLSWAVGVVALILFGVWEAADKDSEYIYSLSLIDVNILPADSTVIILSTYTERAAISDDVYLRQVHQAADWLVRGGLSSFAYKLLPRHQRRTITGAYSACNIHHHHRACACQLLGTPHLDVAYWSDRDDIISVRPIHTVAHVF